MLFALWNEGPSSETVTQTWHILVLRSVLQHPTYKHRINGFLRGVWATIVQPVSTFTSWYTVIWRDGSYGTARDKRESYQIKFMNLSGDRENPRQWSLIDPTSKFYVDAFVVWCSDQNQSFTNHPESILSTGYSAGM